MSQVYFITAHLNCGAHFATYASVLKKNQVPCKIFSSPNLEERLRSLNCDSVTVDLDDPTQNSWRDVLNLEVGSKVTIITDINHSRWINFHESLSRSKADLRHLVYYDNPESYVPGGYSNLAAKVTEKAQGILFANPTLIEKGIQSEPGIYIDLSQKEKIGVGYYPQADADKILNMRGDTKTLEALKASFLERHQIELKDPKVWAYTGGANSDYYEKAFPAFIELIRKTAHEDPEALSNTIVVLQQHPRAKREGNLDANTLNALQEELQSLGLSFSLVVSDLNTFEILSFCDGVLYYQTSMAAQFVLGKIPQIAQVAHETYPDLLIQNGFKSITDAKAFAEMLKSKGESNSPSEELIKRELGIDSNWEVRLVHSLS